MVKVVEKSVLTDRHTLSAPKHNSFIAVNCGVFRKEPSIQSCSGMKRIFTGAVDSRKGYFETVNGGKLFSYGWDRRNATWKHRHVYYVCAETGEYIKVGSSKFRKLMKLLLLPTRNYLNTRIPASSREDPGYRLNTVPIEITCFTRQERRHLLTLGKFTFDFADRYKTTSIQLTDDAGKCSPITAGLR